MEQLTCTCEEKVLYSVFLLHLETFTNKCLYIYVGTQDGEKNVTEAIRLYEQAVEGGSVSAMNGLGYLYFYGQVTRHGSKFLSQSFNSILFIGCAKERNKSFLLLFSSSRNGE